MEESRQIPRLATAIPFFSGALIILALAILGIWPDLEASLFDSSIVTEESLDGLRCPMALAADEVGTVRVVFENPLDRPMQFLVRARISEGSVIMMREYSTVVAMDVGESQEVAWEVTPADAAFGSFVMARVHAYRSFPFPSRQSTCGIGVLPISGVKGDSVVLVATIVGLLSMGLGAALWVRQQSPLVGRRLDLARGYGILSLMLVAALVAGYLGWWLPGLLVLVGAVILIASMFERFMLR
jgi:hypothetical protein